LAAREFARIALCIGRRKTHLLERRGNPGAAFRLAPGGASSEKKGSAISRSTRHKGSKLPYGSCRTT
jgi:hypothetical protein